MNDKVICITGCLGFIGSHFTELCLNKGWWVIGVDKCTYAANLEMIEVFGKYKNFKFIKKDICKLDYLPECDYVINFAAESHVENSIVNSNEFMNSNILGVKNVNINNIKYNETKDKNRHELNPKLIKHLRRLYQPHNEELYSLLGYRIKEWPV